MKIKKIKFIEKVRDTYNDNIIDVFVEKDDGYWLKLYHFADSIDRYVFNKLEAEDRQRQK